MKKPDPHPPKPGQKLLSSLSHYESEYSISGDCGEEYKERAKANGKYRAFVWYWGQVAYALVASSKLSLSIGASMFKNYLKITWRNIKKNKVYSFINIMGLAIGMASCILIFLWVQDELSFDGFHENADRIYRVVFSTSDDGSPTNANGSYGVGPALKKDFPEVTETVRLRKMGQNVKRYVGYKDKKFYESRFFFAEPTLFTVFDFPLIKGDAATALNEPNSLVLTEKTAKKYFGNEDPIGKVIEADPYNDGELMLFHITGVAKNVPHNSHFHFDLLASYSSLKEDTERFSGFYQHFTYLLLSSHASAEPLNSKLLDFLHRNWMDDPWYTLSLQPLLDIHLHSRLKSEIEPTGSILYVYLFTAIALFVLVIACINFTNLTTALAVKRAREVGIRKVVGARKKQLIRQFLGESLWLSLVSGLAAVLLISIFLPPFNSLAGKEFSLASLMNPLFILGMAAIVLAVGFFSGTYPAFFLSSFRPVNTLKSGSSHSSSGTLLRKGLVIFQFSLSIGIIFATLVTHKQMTYIQSRNLGYDREQIMVIPLNKDLRQNYEAVRNELLKHPGIENTATSALVPTKGSYHIPFQYQGSEENISQVVYFVDKEFVDTYGLQLLAGKNIQNPLSEDKIMDILASEKSIQEAGYASTQEAVGKSFTTLEGHKGYVLGVVNDINIYSFHVPQLPVNYVVTPINRHNYVSVRIIPQNISETIGYLQKTWKEMVPNYPLDYFFLDASFEQMHAADQKMSLIFSVFSILAVFVACLGLFGLAAYTAGQKTKEIGVRKILGASTSTIYILLSREFLKWVVLANIIAWPPAYYAMNQWLQNFAFRTNPNVWTFVFSGLIALGIAFLTVSYQAIKAASANPVDSLRYE
jgi:putative ABC transport system permease protein